LEETFVKPKKYHVVKASAKIRMKYGLIQGRPITRSCKGNGKTKIHGKSYASVTNV
jgi:hypothetical protein